MPKSLLFARLGRWKRKAHLSLSQGLLWGALAGGIIGTGISLSIGLFYSSAASLVCAVILVSILMGSIFAQVMAHLLEAEGIIYESRRAARAPEQDGLADHRILKQQQHRAISNQEVMELIHSVRNAGYGNAPITPAPLFALIRTDMGKPEGQPIRP